MLNVKVGDEVRVFDVNGSRIGQPKGGWPGTVAAIGRKYFTVEYGRNSDRFELSSGYKPDAARHRYVRTLDQVALADRWRKAEEALDAHRIQLRSGHKLTLEQVETLAEVARTFSADAPEED